MKRAAAIIAGLVLVGFGAYLAWLNPEAVEFRLAPAWRVSGQVGVLMMVSFLAGALLVLFAVSVQAGRRAIATWRVERRRRRHRRIEEWEERGEHLVWEGDLQHARALLHKAWQRRPDDAHAVLALAASYRDTGELHRARGLLFDAASQHHTNPDVLLALADAHRAAGEHGPYVEVLERLRALHPHAPRVLRALRDACEDGQRWSEAASLQEAILAEVRDPQAASGERERLTALRYQASLTVADAAARIQALEVLADGRGPALPVLVSLADALQAAGRVDEASVLWERTLRSMPRTVLVERLASLATEQKHRDRLRAILRKLRAEQVQADCIRLLTAELHLADGNIDAAAHELETVQDAGHAPAFLHALWGDIQRRRGALEEALNAYARAQGSPRAYHCTACDRTAPEWCGYCPSCHQWDTYRSAVEIGRA